MKPQLHSYESKPTPDVDDNFDDLSDEDLDEAERRSENGRISTYQAKLDIRAEKRAFEARERAARALAEAPEAPQPIIIQEPSDALFDIVDDDSVVGIPMTKDDFLAEVHRDEAMNAAARAIRKGYGHTAANGIVRAREEKKHRSA